MSASYTIRVQRSNGPRFGPLPTIKVIVFSLISLVLLFVANKLSVSTSWFGQHIYLPIAVDLKHLQNVSASAVTYITNNIYKMDSDFVITKTNKATEAQSSISTIARDENTLWKPTMNNSTEEHRSIPGISCEKSTPEEPKTVFTTTTAPEPLNFTAKATNATNKTTAAATTTTTVAFQKQISGPSSKQRIKKQKNLRRIITKGIPVDFFGEFDYTNKPIHTVRDLSPSTVWSGFASRLSAPLPHNFLPEIIRNDSTNTTGTGMDKATPLCDPVRNRVVGVDRESLVCYVSALPPFVHPEPRFVSDDDRQVWYLQPKNVESMQQGWMKTEYETCLVLRPGATAIYGAIQAGDMYSFQHWHDNALGLIYQMRQGFDLLHKVLHPCNLNQFLMRVDPVAAPMLIQEWAMTGFPLSIPQTPLQGQVCNLIILRRFVRDHDQERVHPEAVEWLLSKFPPRLSINRRKIVWISRQASSAANKRQFRNESIEVQYLRGHLMGFDYFHPKTEALSTVQELRHRLGDACIIIGVHGGQLYNQFYADKDTAVLELMPIDARGWIPLQRSLTADPIAQRAIWHNANVIGQPYWRIHFLAETLGDFQLSIKILELIIEVVQRAGCQVN